MKTKHIIIAVAVIVVVAAAIYLFRTNKKEEEEKDTPDAERPKESLIPWNFTFTPTAQALPSEPENPVEDPIVVESTEKEEYIYEVEEDLPNNVDNMSYDDLKMWLEYKDQFIEMFGFTPKEKSGGEVRAAVVNYNRWLKYKKEYEKVTGKEWTAKYDCDNADDCLKEISISVSAANAEAQKR